MAVPRPVLLAVLGLALCAAAFLATRGAREPGGTVTAVPAQTPAATAPKPAASHRPRHAAKARAAKPHAVPAYVAAAREAADGATNAAPRRTHAATTPARAPRPQHRNRSAHPGPATVATRAKQALARGQVVVFLFTRSGGADDAATRRSVDALRGKHGVMIVKAGAADITAFSPIVSGAGVSQFPSVVVVRAHRRARLLEGYVDAGTLRQTVADALR